MASKDVEQLIRSLEQEGFTVRRTKKGHYKVSRDGGRMVVMPATPSDWRGLRNIRGQLRKIGYQK